MRLVTRYARRLAVGTLIGVTLSQCCGGDSGPTASQLRSLLLSLPDALAQPRPEDETHGYHNDLLRVLADLGLPYHLDARSLEARIQQIPSNPEPSDLSQLVDWVPLQFAHGRLDLLEHACLSIKQKALIGDVGKPQLDQARKGVRWGAEAMLRLGDQATALKFSDNARAAAKSMMIFDPDLRPWAVEENHHAWLLCRCHRPADAIDVLNAELKKLVDSGLSESPEALDAHYLLALALDQKPDLAQAMLQYKHAVDLHEKVLGRNDHRTLRCRAAFLRRLSCPVLAVSPAKTSMFRCDEAVKDGPALLEDCVRELGADHSVTLSVRDTLVNAVTMNMLGQFASSATRETLFKAARAEKALESSQQEIRDLLRQSLDSRLRVLGPDHPDTVETSKRLHSAGE